MGSVYFSILITKNIKEIGWTEKSTEKEPITMLQVINTLVNGAKIRRMEMVFCSIKMEQFMMDNGLMISLKIKDK